MAESGTVPGLVMIGLMAADVRMGARAMRDYCAALGLPYIKPQSRVTGVDNAAAIQGPVYMKYSSHSQVSCVISQNCHLSQMASYRCQLLAQMLWLASETNGWSLAALTCGSALSDQAAYDHCHAYRHPALCCSCRSPG